MSEKPEKQKPDEIDAAAEKSSPDDEGAEQADATRAISEEIESRDEEIAGADEVVFDLDAQIEEFRRQIVEDPENCVHHYNLGEALEELGLHDGAKAEFELALVCDKEKAFAAVIYFGLGNLHYNQLMKGTSANVIKSSVGLLSAHKDKTTITVIVDDDYLNPIKEFENVIRELPTLKADEDIVRYITENTPLNIANTYYKWGSDLIDKSRQLIEYGDEINDVKKALKYLKKTLEIDPNNSAAALLVKIGKQMLAEGWEAYDEYGFQAKKIEGTG